jgi:hypothetical protein
MYLSRKRWIMETKKIAFLPLVRRHKTRVAAKALMRPAMGFVISSSRFLVCVLEGKEPLLPDDFASKTVHAQLLFYSKSDQPG